MLAEALPALRQTDGVESLALFGSVARGAAGTGDVDVLVGFSASADVTLITLARVQNELERLIGRSVDLVGDHHRLSSSVRASIEEDLLRVG